MMLAKQKWGGASSQTPRGESPTGWDEYLPAVRAPRRTVPGEWATWHAFEAADLDPWHFHEVLVDERGIEVSWEVDLWDRAIESHRGILVPQMEDA